LEVDSRRKESLAPPSGKGAVTLVPRVFVLVAMVWMILLGGTILIGIGDSNVRPADVCITCNGPNAWPTVIGIVTVALGVAALAVSLMQRRGAS
jgi:hypothetical protein